jgi:flavin-binding protein dodecin
MAVVKVIEVIAQSKKSWEDAAANAVAEAAKSVDNIKSIYIKDMSAKVEKGKITLYRVNANISFVVGKKKKKK